MPLSSKCANMNLTIRNERKQVWGRHVMEEMMVAKTNQTNCSTQLCNFGREIYIPENQNRQQEGSWLFKKIRKDFFPEKNMGQACGPKIRAKIRPEKRPQRVKPHGGASPFRSPFLVQKMDHFGGPFSEHISVVRENTCSMIVLIPIWLWEMYVWK